MAACGYLSLAVFGKRAQRPACRPWASRARLGLLSPPKRYGDARLGAACTLALNLGTCKYPPIRDILANRRDLLQASTPPEWTSPAHAHVRGANYYQ